MPGMLRWQDMFKSVAFLTWSQRSSQQFWHLCSYIAGLPGARWVSKIFAWRPVISESVEHHSDAAFRRGSFLPLEGYSCFEDSCYAYTTLAQTYFRLLLLHLRELRRPMLDSDCANACAPNRLPGSMRHWFTSFNHSPKQANHWLQRTVG